MAKVLPQGSLRLAEVRRRPGLPRARKPAAHIGSEVLGEEQTGW
ncbi:hypothetical protein [Streptomyces sp. TLI_55]|nr:hypothetical protein [Streptomyces sp. TLI_55]